MDLDERQTAIFAALVLCQPDSAGSGLLGTSTHLQQAPLLKMLQQKLWVILQSALFSHSKINAISGSLLNQSIFAAFADLRALNIRYQEHLQTIVTKNTRLLKNDEFEQKIKCIKNNNVSSEMNFLSKKLTKIDDLTKFQKMQAQNELFNYSMLNISNVDQLKTPTTIYHQSKPLTKSNFIDEERKQSSSSPPLTTEQNLYMQTTNSNIYQTNQQNLYSTISTSSASQHDLLAALAVVATSKEFAQINENGKDTNSKIDLSTKLPTKNNFFVTNIQGDDHLHGGL